MSRPSGARWNICCPEWHGRNRLSPGKRAEARRQKPEARSQKPEPSSQKPEARSQKPEARSQKPEARSQKPEARSHGGIEARSEQITESQFWLLASEFPLPVDQPLLVELLKVFRILIVLAHVFLQTCAWAQHVFAGDGVRFSKRLRVFNPGFVIDGVVIHAGEAFDDMKSVR